jgi:hypothetical protein
MLKKGARAGDIPVVDAAGVETSLAQFRRRGHVVLVHEAFGAADRWAILRKRVAQEGQRWTWLQATFVRPVHPPESLEPGAYLVSRWGDVIETYPPDGWSLDRLEKDILYFEAQDCCDLQKAP